MSHSRRTFIKKMATTSSVFPFLHFPFQLQADNPYTDELDVSIFSKHLQFLDFKEAGQIAAELGFNGVDLTVRPKGHVLPENVVSDLPRAIKDIKDGGSDCKLMTTAIQDVANQYDIDIIKTAASSGVKFYRSNWFKYHKDRSMTESMEVYKEKVKELGKVNKEHNIIGCYQNHAGTSIGASFWELKMLMEKANTDYFGIQYDIRHATVEGGRSWKNGLKLLKDHIKMIVLKDFKWGKIDGQWQLINVPIGEGMIDFTKYFQILKSYGLNPPVTLHLEYPLGGAEHGHDSITVDKKVVFDAMKKDLIAVRKLWKEA